MNNTNSNSNSNNNTTVIIGGGVVGCSIAYFLAQRNHPTLLIEQHDVACAASGKAGGFLASDWSTGTALHQLAQLSFHLHAQIAQQLKQHDDVGYRRVDTFAVRCSDRKKGKGAAGGKRRRSRGADERLDWFDGMEAKMERIGTEATTAQVHPRLLTRALLDDAIRRGHCELRIGRVVGIDVEDGRVTGVRLEGQDERIAATRVIVAMGPWSHVACEWLPSIPRVVGRKAQSVVFAAELPATPCFISYDDGSGEERDPEIYPRPDGTVYISDSCQQVPVPTDPDDIQPGETEAENLVAMARRMVSKLQDADIVAQQACYLPVSDANDGLPLIGRVPGAEGAYIATAHSCWGILLGPATGLAMSELILDGEATSVDLSPFQI